MFLQCIQRITLSNELQSYGETNTYQPPISDTVSDTERLDRSAQNPERAALRDCAGVGFTSAA